MFLNETFLAIFKHCLAFSHTNGNSNSSTSCADVLLSFFFFFFCFWTPIDTKGKYAFLRRRRRHRFSLGTLKRKKWLKTFFFHLKLILLLAPRAFFVAEKKCFCFATTKVAFAAFFRITPQYLAKQSSFFLTGLHSNRKWPKMSRLENIVSEVSNVYFQNCLCPNNISVVTIFTPFCWVILSSFSIFTPFCWVSFCAVPILPPFIRSVLS